MAFNPFPTNYVPEPTRPASGPTPGALALMAWTLGNWDAADARDDADPFNLGIFNPRDVCGNPWPHWSCVGSQHARGAAGDVGYPNVGPAGHPEGWKYARWLVANAATLGIQEVIYAGQRWTNQTRRWEPYHGRDDHTGHVHWALNGSGARYLTSARIASVAPFPAPVIPPALVLGDDELMVLRRIESPKHSVLVVTDKTSKIGVRGFHSADNGIRSSVEVELDGSAWSKIIDHWFIPNAALVEA